MKRSTAFFLGIASLTVALGASTMAGCQSDTTGGGAGTSSSSSSGSGGSASSSSGTAGGTTSSSSSSSSGTGGAAQEVTIQDIATGKVGPKIPVQVNGVVAMTKKFLVSKSNNTGSCLWGIFVSAPGLTETGESTGALAVSYGTQATIPDGGTKAFCPVIEQGEPAGDGFPDDVKPGDVLDLTGKTDKFLSTSCTDPGQSTVGQIQISNVITAVKKGTAAVPAPHVFTPADLTTLAGQTDSAFFSKWGGVKVRVQNVKPLVVTPDGGAPTIVGDFGKIKLEGSNAEIGDKIYYQGLMASLGDVCRKGPVYADNNVTFTQVDGFVYLNFCTWDLEPANRCVDLQPPSDDCAGELCP